METSNHGNNHCADLNTTLVSDIKQHTDEDENGHGIPDISDNNENNHCADINFTLVSDTKQRTDICEQDLESSDTNDNNENPMKFNKWQIKKNVVVISLGFTFLFTAFGSVSNLQTSLNKEEGVGAWSMFTIYVSVIVSMIQLEKHEQEMSLYP